MTLGIQISGSGPHLVLLHGWGLNSLVWDSILPRLTRDFTVTRIDLPGHGASSWPPEFHDAGSLAAVLAPQLPASCALLGWSLGGMAAIELALAGRARIEQLILVSTTPKFTAADDWEYGLPAPAVDRFAALLETDYESTVREFLGLQVRGDEHGRATLRELRQKLLAGGKPKLEALRAGLHILRAADQRDRLERIAVPTLVIAGEYDRMTPPQAARAIAAAVPAARFESIPRAGHAPFLSHPGEFCRLVVTFLGRAVRATGS
jgi:pimeloyl-[acyl-carrier protein] methyl ester esterase